jgi:hypothetical protein
MSHAVTRLAARNNSYFSFQFFDGVKSSPTQLPLIVLFFLKILFSSGRELDLICLLLSTQAKVNGEHPNVIQLSS